MQDHPWPAGQASSRLHAATAGYPAAINSNRNKNSSTAVAA